jgi:hypothetical protein
MEEELSSQLEVSLAVDIPQPVLADGSGGLIEGLLTHDSQSIDTFGGLLLSHDCLQACGCTMLLELYIQGLLALRCLLAANVTAMNTLDLDGSLDESLVSIPFIALLANNSICFPTAHATLDHHCGNQESLLECLDISSSLPASCDPLKCCRSLVKLFQILPGQHSHCMPLDDHRSIMPLPH